MKKQNEIWKVYKETFHPRWGHNKWEFSNLGRVKKNGIIIEPELHNNYLRVGVGSRSIHRIVAELFIPNPENKSQVDHIDTNTLNNRVDNLRWVTPKENQNNILTKQNISISIKKWNIGRDVSGKNNPMYGKPSAIKGKHKVWDNKELNIFHFE